jgi:transcriptional regulator with XRE-family HTH domain
VTPIFAWEVAANIGGRLRELREVLDWTQEDLGKELGRRRQSVIQYEAGRVQPPRRRLEDLCRRHHWPLEIFAEGGPRPSELLLRRPFAATQGVSADHRPGQGPEAASEWKRIAEAGGDIEAAARELGDPATWDEEMLLTVLERIGRTVRETLAGVDAAGVHQLKIVALREMIRVARVQGHALPDVFDRVLHGLETP